MHGQWRKPSATDHDRRALLRFVRTTNVFSLPKVPSQPLSSFCLLFEFCGLLVRLRCHWLVLCMRTEEVDLLFMLFGACTWEHSSIATRLFAALELSRSVLFDSTRHLLNQYNLCQHRLASQSNNKPCGTLPVHASYLPE